MQRYAIIVAGGKGLRMGGETPKQFLPLGEKPVIVHTIDQFLSFDDETKIIVVLPAEHISTWQEIKSIHFPYTEIQPIAGGEQRFDSVKAGLSLIKDEGLVAIHDAVRPFVTKDTIAESYKSAHKHGSGVATVPLKDSIRELKKGVSKTRNRANFRLVQTPQTFRVKEIKLAFQQASNSQHTDDASVYEDAGYDVHLVEGSYGNIKITTREDLK
jgi:2-C-methyl-D-erythritol 4-phosphate cytidylyltransferase